MRRRSWSLSSPWFKINKNFRGYVPLIIALLSCDSRRPIKHTRHASSELLWARIFRLQRWIFLLFLQLLYVQDAFKTSATMGAADHVKSQTMRFWQMHPPKLKPYCIIWNELPQALASMSIHTKRNIWALIEQATFPHWTVALWN